MATISRGTTLGATEQVTNAKLHALVDSATITGIVDADIAVGAGISFSKLAEAAIDGSKLTGLSNIVSGAGTIPVANLPLSTIYPVGCIYTSTASTNPNTIFGFGTWVAFGKGQVLVGKGDSGTFVTAGVTGGAETVTLDTTMIPAHTHTTRYSSVESGSGYPNAATAALHAVNAGLDTLTSSTGGGLAHNNLQPYIVVYMFTRTA